MIEFSRNLVTLFLKNFSVSSNPLQILDECHHCGKEHPYASIMTRYHQSSLRPQVSGDLGDLLYL